MISDFFYWQFITSPQKIFFIAKKTVFYLYHQFSIGYLFKTLFEPWKKDTVGMANPTLQDRLRIFVFNLIARFMGFVVRTLTILAGFIIIFIVFILSTIAFVVWVLLPFIAIYMIYMGMLYE